MIMGLFALLLSLFGCKKSNNVAHNQKPPLDPRKERTEAKLKTLGIPINPGLPRVETEEETTIRDPKDVARRAVILYILVGVVFGNDREDSIRFLKEASLWDYVSPKEISFLENQEPSEQEKINTGWRSEALWTLLWAMKIIKELELPINQCNLELIPTLIPKRAEITQYIDTATLRTKSEILDKTDLIYRIHWAVVEAQLKKTPMPAGLDAGIVIERHYALNWLVWYADGWDDITTDT
jgi:hypothetical protein